MSRGSRGLALFGMAALLAVGGYFGTMKAVAARHRRLYESRIEAGKAKAGGTTYHVSPSGDDTGAGTDPSKPWKTIARVNTVDFQAGDRILFQGGATFAGSLVLDAGDAGAPAHPLRVGSYGQGRARIDAGQGTGIRVHNTMGVEISDLVIVGSGVETNQGSGIAVENDLLGDLKLPHVRIDGVEVSGFGQYGILVDGNHGKSGFRDVRITRADAHDNALAGIYVQGEFSTAARDYAHEDVTIAQARAYRNTGLPGRRRQHTGSGIVVSDTNRAVIERCVAFENGARSESNQGGPVGIWAWDSNEVTIQLNESHHNTVGGKLDGGGFDLDGGTTNSLVQYNYSHDNLGAGYLVAQFEGARPQHGNTIRYNISLNDGRKNGYAGIQVFGDVGLTEIYNNTVSLAPAEGGPRAVYVMNATRDIRFRNNLFEVSGGVPLVEVTAGQQGMLFQGNHYASSGPLVLKWAGKTYDGLDAWRSASGQERVGEVPAGSQGEPALQMAAQAAITFDDTSRLPELTGCVPSQGSPLVDAGLDLASAFGLKPGARDFRGTPVPSGGGFDVGACEVGAFEAGAAGTR